jgi:hypothetical protein
MNLDRALDDLAYAVAYRMMGAAARRLLRISLWRELGEAAPTCPELAVLEDEDALICGRRPPVSHYDHAVLAREAQEATAPPFDREFWRNRRADLEGAGFAPHDAVQVIAAVRLALGDNTPIGSDEGDQYPSGEGRGWVRGLS